MLLLVRWSVLPPFALFGGMHYDETLIKLEGLRMGGDFEVNVGRAA